MSHPISGLQREAVMQALELFAAQGREAFLREHASGAARGCWVRHPRTGQLCDGLAIVDVACRFQLSGPLACTGGARPDDDALTTAEMVRISGVAFRTMQDIEQAHSGGRGQTMNRLFGVLESFLRPRVRRQAFLRH